MNMNLLADLLSDILTTPTPEPPPDVRLSDDWYEFEDTLGRYKLEYLTKLGELRDKNNRLTRHMNDVNLLTNVASMVHTESIQTSLKNSIEQYRSEVNIDELRAEVNQLNGAVAAMEGVLLNTHARRYNAFTCPICMDRLVDTFLDPCGHMACERCLSRIDNLAACPTCRRQLSSTKKMFPLM